MELGPAITPIGGDIFRSLTDLMLTTIQPRFLAVGHVIRATAHVAGQKSNLGSG